MIDAHVHFWKYDKKRYDWIDKDMKILQQDYLPEHFALTMKRNEISGVVAVQAEQSELETHFLVELAKTHPAIRGVVGWVDLQADNVEARLQYFSQYNIIKGYRHIVQGEPNDFLVSQNFRRGVSALKPYNYTYDILIYHHQLKPALEFAAALPGMKLVIDHCAKPDIRHKNIDEWKTLIQEMGNQVERMERRRFLSISRCGVRRLRHRPSIIRQRLARDVAVGHICTMEKPAGKIHGEFSGGRKRKSFWRQRHSIL
jgi:L-fuconolactonase